MFLQLKNFLLKLFLLIGIISFSALSFAASNYAEALQKSIFFYDFQRLGKIKQQTGILANRVYWRSDSFLQDYALPNAEGAIDLGGGYADAGDNVKFNFPMAFSMTMLAWGIIEYRSAFVKTNQLTPLLANLRWGTDYLLKCWDAAHTRLYGQVSPDSVSAEHSNLWMPFEVIDQASIDKKLPRYGFYIDATHPGTDLAGETVAALAAASLAFQETDKAYATTLLNAAKSIYSSLVNVANKGKYSDNLGRLENKTWTKADVSPFYNSWSGYDDEISWASMWLYRLTQDASYSTIAKQTILMGNLAATQSWDDKTYGTYLLLAKFLPDSDPVKAEAKQSAEGFLNAWSKGTNGHYFSKDGLAIATALQPWGNARYAASTALMALIYDTYFNATTYQAFAKGQIDYILGANSKNFSYMEGYGERFPRQAHHATEQGRWGGNNDVNSPINNRHIGYGALVGGPKDGNDTYIDDRGDYIGNEIAMDYNAGYVGALAGLYTIYGGSTLPAGQFPPTPQFENVPREEIFVNGSVQSGQVGSDNSSVQVSLLATNHSAWPARVTKNLKLKYFVNLADKPANGTVTVQTFGTDSRAVISDLTIFDATKKIYVVSVWFKDIPIYPGGDERAISSKETQLKFQFNWPHDYTKDWSYQGLGSQNNYKVSANVPIYEVINGSDQLIYGQEPVVKPQGTLTLNFENNLPVPCVGAKDILKVDDLGEGIFTIGKTPFNYSTQIGGPYPVSLASTSIPIEVNNGTCIGKLNATTVNVPGSLIATYSFIPVDKGAIKVGLASSSDDKCLGAADTLFIDQDTKGTPFNVSSEGVTQPATTGNHTVKLASQNGIPATGNLAGTCTSTLDRAFVTVLKGETSLVNATYQFKLNPTGMVCTIDSAKVIQQADWGFPVNQFEIKFHLTNFTNEPDGSIKLDGKFITVNNFVQSFWSNFNMSSSGYTQNLATFKGSVWQTSGLSLSGFIDNTVPMQLGDNPLKSMVLNGVTCQ